MRPMSFMGNRKKPKEKSPEEVRMEAIRSVFNDMTSKILKQQADRAIQAVRHGYEGKFYE